MRKYNEVGKFQMESSVMRISDPMYAPDVWCAATLDNCVTGTWTATVGIQDEGEFGNRVAILFARHSRGPKLKDAEYIYTSEEDGQGYIHWPHTWKKVDAQIGVDSASCGFFDDATYQDDSIIEYEPNCPSSEPKWLNACWNHTTSEAQAGVLPNGCVCTSGYGDGVYHAFYHTNTKGQVDAVAVVFL